MKKRVDPWEINSSRLAEIVKQLPNIKIHRQFIFFGPVVAIQDKNTRTILKPPFRVTFTNIKNKVIPTLTVSESTGQKREINLLKRQILEKIGITKNACN